MKATQATPLFEQHPTISTQVLSETANVALKKLSLPLAETSNLLAMLEATCVVEIVTPATMQRALDITGRYGFSWFDSLIVAAALDAGCDTLSIQKTCSMIDSGKLPPPVNDARCKECSLKEICQPDALAERHRLKSLREELFSAAG